MTLKHIVDVHIATLGGVRSGKWNKPDFDTFHTIAFERDFMLNLIGFGTAVKRGGEVVLLCNKPMRDDDEVVGPVLPGHALNLWLWFAFVPEAYREDVEGVVPFLEREFLHQKLTLTETTLLIIVDAIRQWVGEHIEPTDEHEPRSVRWARAWYKLGVVAAQRQGRITHHEADRLMDAMK